MQLKQFIVGKGVEAAARPLAQAVAMTMIVGARRLRPPSGPDGPEIGLRALREMSIHGEQCSPFVQAWQEAWPSGASTLPAARPGHLQRLQDGERAAAAPAMTLEQITARAREKIAARRAAEAAAAPIDQAERRQRRAEKLAARTAEQREQAQAKLVAAVALKPQAIDRADAEEARAKIKEYEQARPKAEKSLADAEKNLDTIRRAPMPAPWNLPARGARTKAEAEAQKAADQAKRLIKEILEFLFGKPGESTRSKAARPVKQEIQAEIHSRMARRDQLDARLARLEAAADAAAEEKARLLADQDGRAAFTRPAAGAPGQPPRIPKI